ncbi:MAG TPA: DUF2085 domain-containing protein [Pyrinomonadaceae bacterium]|nr:DUF2085 domain-containing protein [Pyrinomonadaceae bacterium]
MDLRFSISIPNAVGCEPEDRTPRHALIIWACVAVIACLLVSSIVVAPVAQAAGHTTLAVFVYKTFSYLCHQIPERSFHLAGHKFAVCSRCTGLYSGFALATLIYPLMRSLKRTDTPRLIWLVLASIPIAVDFLLGYFNIWQNTHLSRFLTGALLGSAAVFYIVPGLIELSSVIVQRFRAKETPPSLSQL